jgi:hypothetical protein
MPTVQQRAAAQKLIDRQHALSNEAPPPKPVTGGARLVSRAHGKSGWLGGQPSRSAS